MFVLAGAAGAASAINEILHAGVDEILPVAEAPGDARGHGACLLPRHHVDARIAHHRHFGRTQPHLRRDRPRPLAGVSPQSPRTAIKRRTSRVTVSPIWPSHESAGRMPMSPHALVLRPLDDEGRQRSKTETHPLDSPQGRQRPPWPGATARMTAFRPAERPSRRGGGDEQSGPAR